MFSACALSKTATIRASIFSDFDSVNGHNYDRFIAGWQSVQACEFTIAQAAVRFDQGPCVAWATAHGFWNENRGLAATEFDKGRAFREIRCKARATESVRHGAGSPTRARPLPEGRAWRLSAK